MRELLPVLGLAVVALAAGCNHSGVGLTVDVRGHGRVESTPAAIDCASSGAGPEGNCFFWSDETTTLTLHAEPATGATFVGWTFAFDCTGRECPPYPTFSEASDTATVPLQAYPSRGHVSVTATFAGP
jgi:hypothetical protein